MATTTTVTTESGTRYFVETDEEGNTYVTRQSTVQLRDLGGAKVGFGPDGELVESIEPLEVGGVLFAVFPSGHRIRSTPIVEIVEEEL